MSAGHAVRDSGAYHATVYRLRTQECEGSPPRMIT